MDSINIHHGMTNIVHSPGDGSLKHSTRRRRDVDVGTLDGTVLVAPP